MAVFKRRGPLGEIEVAAAVALWLQVCIGSLYTNNARLVDTGET